MTVDGVVPKALRAERKVTPQDIVSQQLRRVDNRSEGNAPMQKTTSKTVRDANFVERLFGLHHYKTTISNGRTRAEGLGRNRKEAEKRASNRWNPPPKKPKKK